MDAFTYICAMYMSEYIKKVPPAVIEAELKQEYFMRHTNKGGNEIYIVDAYSAPNTMREIGRLREIAFRTAGGGTGKPFDVDEFDTMEVPCRQLLVWSPVDKAIIGAYRFILGNDMKVENGVPRIAASHMFRFSKEFIDKYLPYTIELGRSFVSVEYQSTRQNTHSIYALDNLWDGLGALTIIYPHVKYLFGKFTMYPNYPVECRDMLLAFLRLYFQDKEQLIVPINPICQNDTGKYSHLFCGNDFKEDYRVLNMFIRNHGYNIPPLVNAYMSLSPTMKLFGTAINHEFGAVEESGILVVIDEIREEKKRRHIQSYCEQINHDHSI